jgi:hypothetical protein
MICKCCPWLPGAGMRSTGPKTAAGKLKSSRNAYRHGLSGPMTLDPAVSTKVDAIARVLAGERETGDRLTSARKFCPRATGAPADPRDPHRMVGGD